MHMVHIAHLDLTWEWRLHDTIQMCLDTIRWNVGLLEKHPDATYSHAQMIILKIVEELDRPLFERFAKLVREGRIEIDSGQVAESDNNMPCGESLARQFLYGQRYIKEKFGIYAKTFVNSDSFGHCRSLPQILKNSHIEYMLFKRPTQVREIPETPFVWKGIDGTLVPAFRFINKGDGVPRFSCLDHLGTVYAPEGANLLQEKIDRNIAAGMHHLFGTHCNSDSGGVSVYLKPVKGKGYNLFYSKPTEFFEALLADKPNLSVSDRLLNYQFEGCYTTHIKEKENCRRAERELRQVENLWALASLAGAGYPSKSIAENWWRFGYLMFHDVLPGTGSPEAHRDCESHYHEIFLGMDILRRRAQLFIDGFYDDKDIFRTFLVLDGNASGRSKPTAADVDMKISRGMPYTGGSIKEKGILSDEYGNKIPYQITDKKTYQSYVHGTMIFNAGNLPPFGIKAFYMEMEQGDPPQTDLIVGDNVIENEYYIVEAGESGILKSIKSKKDTREWLKQKSSPVAIELWPETPPSTHWPAWVLDTSGHREQAVCAEPPVIAETGPVRATIRAKYKWGNSVFVTDVSLYSGQEWVEIRIDIDWHEKNVLARLCIEPELSGNLRRTYGIPFGYEKATGEEIEVPAVGWVDITGENGGMALLDRDRPGHTFVENALRVSLARCSTGPYDPCSDSGKISTAFRLIPHSGSFDLAHVPEKSDEFLHPPAAWQKTAAYSGSGDKKIPSAPIRIDGDGIVVSAFKATETGDGYLLRIYESLGKRTTCGIHTGGLLSGCKAFAADFIEEETGGLEMKNGLMTLDFAAFEIKTIVFKTADLIPDIM